MLSHRAVPRAPWCESILGLKVEAVQGNWFPWNGLRNLGDSGNGGTTLEFLSGDSNSEHILLRRQVGRVGNTVQVIKIAGGGKTVRMSVTPSYMAC